MEWGWGCASAPLWCPPSAAPKRPSTLAGWLAGAFDRARAATCFDAPPSLVSLRLALSSCEAMAAARASPPGPFTGVQPRYPEPAGTMRSAGGFGIDPIFPIYQALGSGETAFRR